MMTMSMVSACLMRSTNELHASVTQSLRAVRDPVAPRAAFIIHFFDSSSSSSSADGLGISCTALKKSGTCSKGTVYAREESWENGENKFGVCGTGWAETLAGTGTSSTAGAVDADLELESGKIKVVRAR